MKGKEEVEREIEELEAMITDLDEEYSELSRKKYVVNSEILPLQEQINSLESKKRKLLTYYEGLIDKNDKLSKNVLALIEDYWYRCEDGWLAQKCKSEKALAEADIVSALDEDESFKKDKEQYMKYCEEVYRCNHEPWWLEPLTAITTILGVICGGTPAYVLETSTGDWAVGLILLMIGVPIGYTAGLCIPSTILEFVTRAKKSKLKSKIISKRADISRFLRNKENAKTLIANAIDKVSEEVKQAVATKNDMLTEYGLPEDYDPVKEADQQKKRDKEMRELHSKEVESETRLADLKDYYRVITDDPINPINPAPFTNDEGGHQKSIGVRKENK